MEGSRARCTLMEIQSKRSTAEAGGGGGGVVGTHQKAVVRTEELNRCEACGIWQLGIAGQQHFIDNSSMKLRCGPHSVVQERGRHLEEGFH